MHPTFHIPLLKLFTQLAEGRIELYKMSDLITVIELTLRLWNIACRALLQKVFGKLIATNPDSTTDCGTLFTTDFYVQE